MLSFYNYCVYHYFCVYTYTVFITVLVCMYVANCTRIDHYLTTIQLAIVIWMVLFMNCLNTCLASFVVVDTLDTF